MTSHQRSHVWGPGERCVICAMRKHWEGAKHPCDGVVVAQTSAAARARAQRRAEIEAKEAKS